MKVRTFAWMSMLAAGLALSACGGSDDGPDPLAAVPSSASESSDGMVSYIESVRPRDADSADPVSLDNFVPPTSEDADPKPVTE